MQNFIRSSLIRRITCCAAALAIGFFEPSCSTLSASQRSALLVSAESLANVAGAAAATYYGGAAAGQLASAGLSALASVLQGYVGATVPTDVVQASPGVANVGEAVATVIAPNQPVTQSDVNTVNQAASIAATLPLVTTAAATAE